MIRLREFIFSILILLIFDGFFLCSQTLIVNEVSQGETGNMEYVEFVVVDNTVSYSCTSLTPPCIDIRGWIIDDNSGFHGTAGVASGANRFSNDPMWSCVPLGTIILVYNDAQTNPEIPADDLSLNDGNCAIVAPISSTLFESNNTTPGAVACSYPSTGWTTGGNWLNISMANGGDCFRIVNLSGCEVFSVCWGSNDLNNLIYFPGNAGNTVFSFTNGDPTNQTNWLSGCADLPACGTQDQTPGSPNSTQNSNYISQFNNNCQPITPVVANAFEQTPTDCGCSGEALVGVSGSIPGYTFEWTDNNFTPIGQNSNMATGLCAGTYHVIVESSIGCADTSSVTITSNYSGGLTAMVSPNPDTVNCSINSLPAYQNLNDFLNAGGSLQGAIGAAVPSSFVMLNETYIGNSCPEEWARTYQIEDSCGNLFQADHSVFVQDLTPPAGTAPPDMTVQCVGDVPMANVAVVSGVTDNCSTSPTVTHLQDIYSGNPCDGEEVTRTYSISDDCGNSTIVSQTIFIDADLPVFDISSINPSDCGLNDGEITLTGLNPNENYTFSFNGNPVISITTNSQGEYNLTNLSTGTYEDFIVSPNSCTQCEYLKDTILILYDPGAPNINAGADLEICEGDEITLIAQNPDGANISWDNGIQNGVGFTPSLGTTDYIVTGELNGCISTDEITVAVNSIPNVDAGADKVVCYGQNITLSASGADAYDWSGGLMNNETFVPQSSNTFTVQGTTNGCSAEDQVTVTVLDNIEVSFEAEVQNICSSDSVNLSTTTTYDDAIYYWTFSNGKILTGENVRLKFEGAGCFDVTLRVELSSGCSESTTKEDYICLLPEPEADFIYSPDHISEFNNEIRFTNNSENAVEYIWDFDSDSLFTSTETDPNHLFTDFSRDFYNVSLIATNEFGCSDTMIQPILVKEELLFFVPNTFTPNGDGRNSEFLPIFAGGFDPLNYQLSIFNRWGELIFVSQNIQRGWDGTYNATNFKKAPDGVYVWKMEFDSQYSSERFSKVGHVTLLR